MMKQQITIGMKVAEKSVILLYERTTLYLV